MTPRRPPPPALLRAFRAAWILALVSLGVAGATSYPLTVHDELGHELTLSAPPARIVSMMPAHTETVCALGACDALVGVDALSNYPDAVAALPDLGSAFTPNLEALVALEPDLVLVDVSTELPAALAQLGLPVYATTAETFAEVSDVFERIGTLLDREAEAARLTADVDARLEAVAAAVAGRPQPRVYYELDPTPYSVGPGSFLDVLLGTAGAANIVPADLGAYPQLDPEFVVASDPEIIVLADAPYGESLASLRSRPGWSSVTAVREDRVVELDDTQIDMLNRPGPRIAEAVELLARLFHPDAF